MHVKIAEGFFKSLHREQKKRSIAAQSVRMNIGERQKNGNTKSPRPACNAGRNLKHGPHGRKKEVANIVHGIAIEILNENRKREFARTVEIRLASRKARLIFAALGNVALPVQRRKNGLLGKSNFDNVNSAEKNFGSSVARFYMGAVIFVQKNAITNHAQSSAFPCPHFIQGQSGEPYGTRFLNAMSINVKVVDFQAKDFISIMLNSNEMVAMKTNQI